MIKVEQGRVLLWIPVFVFCGALGACSAVVDFEECSIDTDCKLGLVCTDEGYCVTPESAYEGPTFSSEECVNTYGPVHEDNVMLIGTLLPITGPDADLGNAHEKAVILAVDAFNANGGIGADGRSLGVILCDTKSDANRGVEAAKHLISLGVTAAVGPALGPVALAVGSQVAPFGTTDGSPGLLVISPSAHDMAISDVADNGMLWRMVPSNELQAEAITKMLKNPVDYGLPADGNLMILHLQGDYGQGLADALQGRLFEANLGYNNEIVSYPPPDGSQEWFEPYWTAIKAGSPNIIVLIGGSEAAGIFAWIEHAIKVGGVELSPIQWIASDTLQTDSLFAQVDKWKDRQEGDTTVQVYDPEEVLGRLRGTSFGMSKGAVFDNFVSAYSAAYGIPVSHKSTAESYDATYMIAYAMASALGKSPGGVTAKQVRDGVLQLFGGDVISILPEEIPLAMTKLGPDGAGTVDLEGASSELKFEGSGEPLSGLVEIWTPKLPDSFSSTPILSN